MAKRGGMRTTVRMTKRAGKPKRTRTGASKRTRTGASKRSPKVVAKRARKVSARKAKSRAYNPQTGRLTGRAVAASTRRDRLTQTYMAEGMDAQTARERALAEMRSGGRKDWRDG